MCSCLDLTNVWPNLACGRIHLLCLCGLWQTLTLLLFGLSEFRKKNAGKKAAVPKGKGDERKKKRKAEAEPEAEPSDKGDGGDDDQ